MHSCTGVLNFFAMFDYGRLIPRFEVGGKQDALSIPGVAVPEFRPCAVKFLCDCRVIDAGIRRRSLGVGTLRFSQHNVIAWHVRASGGFDGGHFGGGVTGRQAAVGRTTRWRGASEVFWDSRRAGQRVATECGYTAIEKA